MKKKALILLLVLAMAISLAFGLTACNKENEDLHEIELPAYAVESPDYSSITVPANFKIGLICLHDENSTYDKNFIEAFKATQKQFGLTDEQVIIATGIPEGDECYQKACELAEAGCDVIFADSFGHEEHMIKAAEKYKNVQFCHATGTQAHVKNLPNYSNAFASIYEGRFLAGVAAGMKLNEMINDGKITADKAKMGYVGAYTYAEVISGYTSFYLGAKSVCPSVTMDVTFTGSWYDEAAENNAAKSLISRGCVLISQHADSMGAPNACEEAGVPNVSYNGSTLAACTDTFIISSRINWTPYYNYVVSQVIKGEAVAKDWCGTIKNGGVVLTNLGGNAMAEGTVEKIVDVRNKLVAGTINVFDTNSFTVTVVEGGKNKYATVDANNKLTAYLADVNGDFVGETNVVSDGYFHESENRSAPYFDIEIDGITLLDRNYGSSN